LNEPQAVLAVLESSPTLLISLIREAPQPLVKRRPRAGTWSLHEHACHLAACEGVIAGRLEHMLAEDNPAIPPHQPSPEDEAGALLELDLGACLARFAAERGVLVERLRSLVPEQWERTGEHPEYERFTVFTLARQAALHDLLHAFRMEQLLLRGAFSEARLEEAPAVPPGPLRVEEVIPGLRARLCPGEVNLVGPLEVPGFDPRPVRIYLPRTWAPEEPHFALYLYDGQNVFGDEGSFSGGWYAHEAAEKLARAGRPVPVIVGIHHGGEGRIRELSPFDVQGNASAAESFVGWVTGALVPALTAELNLIPGPFGAVAGGSSVGGLAALWSHFRYPETFGGALVLSPSFWVDDQAIFRDLAERPLPKVSRIYLDCGTREGRGTLLPLVAGMAAHLAGRGYDEDRLLFNPDPRGAHNERSWRRRLPKALRFLYRSSGPRRPEKGMP
jgi:predicted alpha/beta superfamily hydrolase